jgi:hypothetical protein
MKFFWVFVRNVTPPIGFESVRRFKTLARAAKIAGGQCACEAVFEGACGESFSLRETRHDVSLRAFAAPTVLQTSAV